ncbi:MAG TPA: PAS domain S-box protein, partial [Bacteroidota bacterium]|nr:PAS domain S-box protein [Bacteroidota bacterium]
AFHEKLADYVSSLKDVQRGARGYVISGDPAFLPPFRSGTELVRRQFDTLSSLAPMSSSLSSHMNAIEAFSDQLLRSTAQEVEEVRLGKADSAREIVRSGEANHAMDGVDDVIRQIEDAESRMLSERQSEAEANLRGSLLFLALGGGFSASLIAWCFVLMTRQLRAREAMADAMQRSEQRLQTVINSIHEGITFSNAEGGFEIFNHRMREITGYSIEEANRSGDFSRLIYPHPADRQKALDGLQQIIERPGPHSSETAIVTKSGGKRLLRITSQMLGRLERRMFLTTYEDITEARRIEDAVKESQERYRVLFETSPIPTLICDCVSLAFLEVNPAAIAHYGYTREEFLAMTEHELLAVENPGEATAPPVAGVSDGAGRLCHRKKDGKLIQVAVQSHPLLWQNHQAKLVLVHDITDILETQEELRIQKAYFERLFEAAPEGIALLDDTSRVHNVNKAFEQMFGFSKQEVIRWDLLKMTIPPEGAEEAREALGAVMNGVPIHLEAPRRRKDGQLIDVSIIAVPLDLGRGQKMAYVIYRDVTQRKKGEKEREELIEQLQKALADVKTLSGLLPVCAWCRKVRDDQGYYHQLEAYIAAHSGAKFTHGICPECLEKFKEETERERSTRRETPA